MDCKFSLPSGRPLAPLRSPSRLDFCMQDPDEDDGSESHRMDWDTISPHVLVEEGGEDGSLRAIELHSNPALVPPASPEHPTQQLTVEPQAPIPIRPPPVHFQINDTRGQVSPSRITAQRLNYPHHGFSRSALLHQKAFWNSRHEEWVEWQSRMEQDEAQKQDCETNDAYTGLARAKPHAVESAPPYMRTPSSGLERDLADIQPRKHELDVHASIYPRVGDISALRDPYSVNVDRCFFRYPLWTLHKILYVFNMHHRAGLSTPVCGTEHVQASLSSSTLSSCTSFISGDDEESTLIDDSPIQKGRLPLESLNDVASPPGPPSWTRLSEWGLSWYARWELLIGLFQRDHTICDTLDISMELAVPLESTAAQALPPGRTFCFSAGDSDEDNNDDDSDEDYGTLVSNSSFSVDFDEECERAMAFYSREPKGSEVDW